MHHSKAFSFFKKALYTTPMYGRTIALLGFFCLWIKQLLLFLTSHELLREATFSGTLANYLAYLVSDFFVFFLLLVLVLLNRFIKKRAVKFFNNILLLLVLLLFIIDMFTFYLFQSRVSILDIPQFISPSVWSFGAISISILSLFCL
jgi:hypothetical protein